MSNETATMQTTIPPSDLPGLEQALVRVEKCDGDLAPLMAQAKVIVVSDAQSYQAIGAVLSRVRSIEKQIKAEFSPFDAIVERVRTFLRLEAKKHLIQCAQIDDLCVAKMKIHENNER